MNLYLMRHGKAESIPHNNDTQRKLTKTGIKQINSAAEILARMQINPTQTYCSPRVRAHQTAQIIAEKLNQSVEIRDEVDYNFDVDTIWKLTSHLNAEDNVLFVGHNPSMVKTISLLTGARLEVSPGSIACVAIIRPGSVHGTLRWLLSPDNYS